MKEFNQWQELIDTNPMAALVTVDAVDDDSPWPAINRLFELNPDKSKEGVLKIYKMAVMPLHYQVCRLERDKMCREVFGKDKGLSEMGIYH